MGVCVSVHVCVLVHLPPSSLHLLATILTVSADFSDLLLSKWCIFHKQISLPECAHVFSLVLSLSLSPVLPDALCHYLNSSLQSDAA